VCLVDSSNVTSGQMSATHAPSGVFVSHAVTELHVQLQLLLLNACLKRFWSTLPACSACKCRPFLHMSHIASSRPLITISIAAAHRSHSATSRSALRSRICITVFCHARSPLRSAYSIFHPFCSDFRSTQWRPEGERGGAYGSVSSVPGQSSTVSVDPMSCSLAGTNNIKIHFKNIETTGYAEPNATKTSPLKWVATVVTISLYSEIPSKLTK